MVEESSSVGGDKSDTTNSADSEKIEPTETSPAPAQSSHTRKITKPLLPHDSDFERDPREDDSFSDREKDYLRDKPPHHS